MRTRSPSLNPQLSGFYGRVRCEPGWRLDAAWSDRLTDYDLWLVWAGRGRMRIGRRSIVLLPGTCLWMRPGHRYLAEQDPEHRLGVSFTHFELPEAPPDFRPPFEVTTARSLEFAAASLAEIVRLRPAAPALAAQILATLLQVLTTDDRNLATAPGTPQTTQRNLIHALAARIAAEPGQAWTVAALAQEAGYTVDHFSKRFAAVTGLRPQTFIVRARMTRARQLLAETSLSISEIAAALGFNDVYFFSRQFRAKCGVSPRAFRRKGLTGAVPAFRSETSA